MAAEMAAYYYDRGMTLIDAIDELYKKYGFYSEETVNLFMYGVDGLGEMRTLMASHSTFQSCSITKVCTGMRSCGGSSMVDMSRMPDRAMFSVRGMGVAESVSTSTARLISLMCSLCATPKRCSSSTMSRPRS